MLEPALEPLLENARRPDRPWPGQDVVEEALAAWRARDLAEPEPEELENEEALHEPDDFAPRPVRARPEFEFGTELVAAMREIAEPATEIAPAVVVGLTPGEIDGLDEDLCGKFAEIEIRSLTDLARTDPLELAQASGLGYTQAWRLQCLARRAILAEPEVSAEPEASPSLVLVPYKVSLSEAPRQEDPSILELEWNRELRPTPAAPRATADAPAQEAERESAGGPFA